MIGTRVKLTRKNLGITLEELSKRTGLSVSYLSNLERNETSPTLDNLENICTALEVDLMETIRDSLEFNPFVKKSQRRQIYASTHRTKYELVSEANQNMTASVMTLAKEHFGEETSYGHNVDELIIIERGSLLMILEDKEYLMEEGDSIYIKSHTPHRYRKTSTDECVLYCIKCNRTITNQ